MGRASLLTAVVQAALIGAIALALISATGLAAPHSGGVPQFRRSWPRGPDLALVVENGPFCVSRPPRSPPAIPPCSRSSGSDLASNTRYGLVAYTWRR